MGIICAVGWSLAGGAPRLAGAQAPAPVGGGTPTSDNSPYILRSVADGTYFYRAPGFTASVASDGTVAFHEQAWVPHSVTYELATNPKAWLRPEVWPVPLPTEYRPTEYDQREQDQDSLIPRLPAAVPILGSAELRSDVTDDYTRLMGGDPYGPQKAAFLSGTFDFRMKLAAKQHRAAVSTAIAQLSAELTAVWNDQRFSPAERVRIIYLLWQETSVNDPDGRRARQVIRDFARQNLPPAEAARFTAASPVRE